MLNISNIIKTWPKNEYGWSNAPSGLTWIQEGNWIKCGDNVEIGNDTKIGNFTEIGDFTEIGNFTTIGNGTNLGTCSKVLDNSTECIDLGFYDGYRKVLCLVQGQARIASGCRDFSISEALEHWGNHEKDRKMTFACIKFAKELAEIRGFSYT